MSSCLLNLFVLSSVISSEITVWYSLKFPRAQINTLNHLGDSSMNFVSHHNFNANYLSKKFQNKLKSSEKLSPDVYNNPKYLQDVSQGKTAIFFYEIPLKQLAIAHQDYVNKSIRLRFIEERYDNPFRLTIATSRRLPKTFRDQLNFR